MRITNNNQKNFNGMLSNKHIIKSLETIAEHGASFTAGTSFFMSLVVRPVAINATPNVKKENKQHASTSSFCSALMKLGIVEAVALPVENAIKKIDKNPKNFLNPNSIKRLAENNSKLIDSKSYRLATQILKLGTGFLTAIPKSMLTVALIPIMLDKLFQNNSKTTQPDKKIKKDLTFTGKDFIPKGVAKILNNERFQNFAIKHKNCEADIAKHISAGTDILLTTSYCYNAARSQNIKKEQKRPLILNSVIGTGITLLGGYPIDSFIKKQTKPLIHKFIEANKNSPKLSKYLEGVNVLRPALIFASIYYIALPMLSTFLAEKADAFLTQNESC